MLHYQVKKIPEDFQVSEVLHLQCTPFNEGTTQYYIVKKIGFTTFEMIDIIANHFKILNNEVGYAGLKDEDAITTQYISMPICISKESLKTFNKSYSRENLPFINITYYGAGQEPLKVAKLHGNCFKIKVRNLSPQAVQDLVTGEEYFLYFLNYYGSQRFGLPNQCKNTHLIGKALNEKNYAQAQQEIAAQNSAAGHLARLSYNDPAEFISAMDNKLLAFYQSAYYSHKWNEAITQYLRLEKISFYTKQLDGVDYCFPNKPDDIINMITQKELINNTRVITDGASFIEVPYKRNPVIQTKIYINNITPDNLNPGYYSISLSFYLTTGSYATIAIAQFLQQLLKQLPQAKND